MNPGNPSQKQDKRTSDTWYELDNAANIFPSVSTQNNTNVFRLCCELRETVDRALLQQALDTAMQSYPHFQAVMRRGMFWFYLERTELSPQVEPESERPCARLFYKGVKGLLVRVSYFGRRINLEVFHALADGGGAMGLLRSIVYNYLILRHRRQLPDPLPPLEGESPPAAQAADSFRHHYAAAEKDTLFRQKAYTIGGTVLPGGGVRVIEACVPTKQFLALSKERGVTVTAYMAALLIESIYHDLLPRRARGRTIAVNVPVDLRGHFASRTTRNFFSVVDVSYNFAQGPDDFDSILAEASRQLAEKVRPEALAGRINYTMGVQRNLGTRFTPLLLKNLVLKAAYHKAEKSCTCALSNVGRISMPEAFAPYIDRFVCLLNPTGLHRLKLCVCTFGDRFVMSFTSIIAETGAQTHFIRHLTERGVDVTITANGGYDDEVL